MANNTHLATYTQEVTDENISPLKVDIFALQTHVSDTLEIET